MVEKKLDADILVSAAEFWQRIYREKIVTIQFIKQDGTNRIMKATLDFNKIPMRDRPKSINIPQIMKLIEKNKIIRVYDIENKGWRSVPFDRVDWLQTPKRRFFTRKSLERKTKGGKK